MTNVAGAEACPNAISPGRDSGHKSRVAAHQSIEESRVGEGNAREECNKFTDNPRDTSFPFFASSPTAQMSSQSPRNLNFNREIKSQKEEKKLLQRSEPEWKFMALGYSISFAIITNLWALLLIVLRLLCQGNEEDLPAPPLWLLYLTAEWATMIAFFFSFNIFHKNVYQ
jgi:hypothetical protein